MEKRLRELLLFLLITAFVHLIITLSSDAVQFRSRHMQRRMRHRQQMKTNHYPHYDRETRIRRFVQDANASSRVLNETPFTVTLEAAVKKEMQRDLVAGTGGKLRTKRATFAWPPGTLFIAQFSLEMPLYAPDGVGIPFLIEVPYEFDLPNVTESIITQRSSNDRFSFFTTIESLFNRLGFEGKACMLRVICERAEIDVVSKGLIGEVLNLILKISTSGVESSILGPYKEAEYHGRSTGDCSSKYSRCPISVFHFFD